MVGNLRSSSEGVEVSKIPRSALADDLSGVRVLNNEELASASASSASKWFSLLPLYSFQAL